MPCCGTDAEPSRTKSYRTGPENMNDQNSEEEIVELIKGSALARPGEVMPGIIHLLPVTSRPFFRARLCPADAC